jgi:hypothetical protein
LDDDDDDTDNEDLLLRGIVAPMKRIRKQYICAICNQVGHNASTCTFRSSGGERSANLKSGKYVIGNDPSIECGLPIEIYMEYDKEVYHKNYTEEYRKAVLSILSFTLAIGLHQFLCTYSDMIEFSRNTTNDLLMKTIIDATNDRYYIFPTNGETSIITY